MLPKSDLFGLIPIWPKIAWAVLPTSGIPDMEVSRMARAASCACSSRACDLLGLPKDLLLYVARHSFATGLLDATGNIKLVADASDTRIPRSPAHTFIRQRAGSPISSTSAMNAVVKN